MAAALACTSFCGFQSESKSMQVSAAIRLMPTPPALVESKKMNVSESGLPRASTQIRELDHQPLASRRTHRALISRFTNVQVTLSSRAGPQPAKAINGRLALIRSHGAVQPLISVTALVEVITKDAEHLDHLMQGVRFE